MTENSAELKAIEELRESLNKRIEMLDEEAGEIRKKYRSVEIINVDEAILNDDIKPEAVNYVLGHSQGFVDGFASAINEITAALSSEYRDIPMTESELYMLVELGATKERAWLKDYKQRNLVEKNGWKFDFTKNPPIWIKESTDEE